MKHSIKNALRIFTLLILCQATVTVPMWRQKAKQLAMDLGIRSGITATVIGGSAILKQTFFEKNLVPASDKEKQFILNAVKEVTDPTNIEVMRDTSSTNHSYAAVQNLLPPFKKRIIIENYPNKPSLHDLLLEHDSLDAKENESIYSKFIKFITGHRATTHYEAERLKKKLNRHRASAHHEAGHLFHSDVLKAQGFVGIMLFTILKKSSIFTYIGKILGGTCSFFALRRYCEQEADRFIKNDPNILRAAADDSEKFHRNKQCWKQIEKNILTNQCPSFLKETTKIEISSAIVDIKNYIKSIFSTHPSNASRAAEFRRRADEIEKQQAQQQAQPSN